MYFPFMLTGSILLDEAVKGDIHSITLIMGNEASGLPEFFSTIGTPVRIPHSNNIDSLNLAIAASIGMYAFSRNGGNK